MNLHNWLSSNLSDIIAIVIILSLLFGNSALSLSRLLGRSRYKLKKTVGDVTFEIEAPTLDDLQKMNEIFVQRMKR